MTKILKGKKIILLQLNLFNQILTADYQPAATRLHLQSQSTVQQSVPRQRKISMQNLPKRVHRIKTTKSICSWKVVLLWRICQTTLQSKTFTSTHFTTIFFSISCSSHFIFYSDVSTWLCHHLLQWSGFSAKGASFILLKEQI